MYYMKNEWNTFKSVKDKEIYVERYLKIINDKFSMFSRFQKIGIASLFNAELFKEQIRRSPSKTYFIRPEIVKEVEALPFELDWESSRSLDEKTSTIKSMSVFFQFQSNTVFNGFDIYPFALHYMPFDVRLIQKLPNIRKYTSLHEAVVETCTSYSKCNWGISGLSEYDKSGRTHVGMHNIENDYDDIIDYSYKLGGFKYPQYEPEYTRTIILLAGKLLSLINDNPRKYITDGYPEDFQMIGKTTTIYTVGTTGRHNYEQKSLMHMRRGHKRLLQAKRYEKGGPVPRYISVKPTTVKYKTVVITIDNHIT